jgi:sec-independent protein translocase protein TatC
MNTPIESPLAVSLIENKAPSNLEEMPITRHLMVLRQHLFKIMGLLIALFFTHFLLSSI